MNVIAAPLLALLLAQAADSVHSDAVLYLMNGGALLTIVGLFVHLLRVTIPKKDADTQSLLSAQAKEHRESTAALIKSFREDIHLERESHDREIVRVTGAVDKLTEKLDRVLEINRKLTEKLERELERNSRG